MLLIYSDDDDDDDAKLEAEALEVASAAAGLPQLLLMFLRLY